MRLLALAATVSVVTLAAACGANGQDGAGSGQAGAPLETRPANGASQQPAFAGQTRAPAVRTEAALTHAVVASGLENPSGS
ncbi:MAG: PQQ-dependent sugar dehydrogenase, partial [Brevundimonas sp.]